MMVVRDNTNIGKPEGFLSTELNIRRLKTSAMLISPPVVPPRSNSVPLDRLTDNEALDLRFMTLNNNCDTQAYKC